MKKGRPRQFDKDKALGIALRLFWNHGFEGVSVARLANEMGINIPSLYAAFGNKEQLFIAAVELYGQTNGNIYPHALAQPTAYEVAKTILLAEVDLVSNPNEPDGCLMIQGALVTSPESQNLVVQMAGMRAGAEGWLADRFVLAKKHGDLPPHANPKALACYIMAVNSGLAIQAKTGVTKAELLEVVEIALCSWP